MNINSDFLSKEIIQKISQYESMNNNSASFYLYIHIVPSKISSYKNDKYYVGITSRTPQVRWANGIGYKTQMFYRAIQKYGWDNIEHRILASRLTQNQAEELEKEIISYLKSNQPEYGYNIAPGGLYGGGNCVKIAQYDLDGNYIKSFPSIASAIHEIDPDLMNDGIHWALSKEGRSWRGFMWKTYDNTPMLTINPYIPFDCRTPVLQYDLYGNFIKEWNSLKEASDYYNTYCISNACRKLAPTAVGYQWKYKEDEQHCRTNKPVIQFNNNKQIINIFSNINTAINKTSESRSTIKNSSNKDRLTKRGYYWKLISDISSDNLIFINKDIEENIIQ